MGADFYQDDYGGGYYDGGGGGDVAMLSDGGGGGGIDYGFDTTSWPTFESYYGSGGLPPDYAPGIDPSSGFMDLGGGYVYNPSTGGVLDTGLYQPTSGIDLFGTFFDYYSGQGYDDYTAMQMAAEATQAPAFQLEGEGQMPTPTLPDIGQYFPLPYVPNYDYWQSPPYVPNFPEGPAPSPPLPQSPATQQPNLPPYCPTGQYHPYPIGHPQQNICVPFPTAQTPGAQQRPGGQPSGGAQQPRPPQQQQRPPQQQRCTTPGTVFDQATGRCVPRSQAISPLPSETEDLLSNLKNLPWWVWLALGGAFLLSQGESKTTTVRYRRAS